MSHII